MNRYALILFFLLSYCKTSQAAFEFSIGNNQYKQQINGIWYQEGFQHELDLSDTAWSVGYAGKFFRNIKYRVEYLDLGTARSDAMAVPTDYNYNPSSPNFCNGECQPLAHFVGKGKVTGVVFSLAPEYRLSRVFGIYAEGGVYVYSPTYKVIVTGIDSPEEPGGITHHFAHKSNTEHCWIIGAGIRYRSMDISIRHMQVKASGDNFPAIYNGATVFMTRISF